MKFIDLKQRSAHSFWMFIMLIISLSTFVASEVEAQVNNLKDLTNVKSSQISDTQLKSIIKRGEAEGLTANQAIEMAQQRGLSPNEAALLMRRVRELPSSERDEYETSKSVLRTPLDISDSLTTVFFEEAEEEPKGPIIFGSHLFSNAQLNFEPSMNIPTPVNYVLGAGDEIVVDIWGASTNLYQLVVSAEGTVMIDNVGPVYVHGLTLEEGEKRIVAKLKQLYRGLRPGEAGQDTFVRVSLGRVRTIQVTVLGEVINPGNYMVSSLTTVFNALYRAGGLNDVGSYRKIEIIRDNKIVSTLDIYDFLLTGDQKDNIRLNDQDVVRVGVYEKRVEIDGEIKRPGLYEVVDGEKLSDLIKNSGSFTNNAYSRQLTVKRKTEIEQKIVRVDKKNFSTFDIYDGDVIDVGSLLTRYENRVIIEGAVWRPGEYSLSEGLTLSQLIHKAEGVKPEAFRSRGLIYRLSDIHDFYVEAFNLNEVLQDPDKYDITLQYEDSIVIRNIYEMREEMDVKLNGQIQNPGSYDYKDNMTLGDLILAGNGFKASASEARIEVYRRVDGDIASEERSASMAESFLFTVSRDLVLEGGAKDFRLQPFDQVYVRRRPDYQEQRSVRIEGEVLYPGEYVLRSRNERISDLVARAGGVTSEAYVKGSTLERQAKQLERVDFVLEGSRDEIVELTKSNVNHIGIAMEKVLKSPGSEEDIFLREGDLVKVPLKLQTVAVDGAVLRNSEIRYISGKSLKYYISSSGGYSENARKKSAYVIYANGDVSTRKGFLFFRTSPRITPGAEIIVPAKVVQERLSSGERISILASIVSMAAVVTTAITRF